MNFWQQLEEQIRQTVGNDFSIEKKISVGGGCINSAYKIGNQKLALFIKTNQAHLLDMFEAEADGLREIQASNSITVPEVICSGQIDDQSYLVLQYFATGSASQKGQEDLGKQLARMHDYHQDQFGWHRDNTIGSTPQINTREKDWVTFWSQHRIAYQLELAAAKGYQGALQDRGALLLEKMPELLADHQPLPSLLHGDLWSGNYAITPDHKGIIFDPAVYYGDAEADLAMTELFGGFSSQFYAAYRHHRRLDSGYKLRKNLYNLYHILNHVNLFGGGYLSQGEHLIETLLAEV